MNKAVSYILDLFFPNRCPVCRSFTEYNELVCEKCMKKLEKYTFESIDALPITGAFYDRKLAGYYYENEVKNGIYSLKDGHKEFGYYLGNIISEKIICDETISKADCIIPVPMSAKSFRLRGYNQAAVIAETISTITGIKMMTGILYKHESKVQHSLNMTQRMENVSAYSIKNTDLSGRKIIICDDVCTTGSTINRCAELLKNMGAAEVYAAVGTTTKLKKE